MNLDKIMESASNLLQGVVDAMAFTFFLVVFAHSYLGEAAEHFRRIQGDNLHPSHRYSLGKIAQEAGIYE